MMFKKIALLLMTFIMLVSFSTAEATSEGTGIAEGLNYSIDDFHNRTIYFGRFDVSSAALYPLVAVDTTTHKPTMYIHANCAGNTGNWQYFDKIYVRTDSNSYTINCEEDFCQYYVASGLSLEETYQKKADEQLIAIFRDIARSKGVPTYRFSGKYQKIREITPAKKERIKKLLDLYDFYNKSADIK